MGRAGMQAVSTVWRLQFTGKLPSAGSLLCLCAVHREQVLWPICEAHAQSKGPVKRKAAQIHIPFLDSRLSPSLNTYPCPSPFNSPNSSSICFHPYSPTFVLTQLHFYILLVYRANFWALRNILSLPHILLLHKISLFPISGHPGCGALLYMVQEHIGVLHSHTTGQMLKQENLGLN